jgi:hypothetical protein
VDSGKLKIIGSFLLSIARLAARSALSWSVKAFSSGPGSDGFLDGFLDVLLVAILVLGKGFKWRSQVSI